MREDEDSFLETVPGTSTRGIAKTSEPPVRTPWTPPLPGTRRRPLVPRWVYYATGGALLASVAIAVIVYFVALNAVVRVPSVQGLDRVAATTRLQEIGLRLAVGDKRFSDTVPAGLVVGQTPAPGAKVSEGALVTVFISAGTESFAMPDVTGMPLEKARRLLRERGLAVDMETAVSDRAQGTVIESFPAPGVMVSAGDSVRVTVAAGGSSSGTLLPTDLTGKTIVLDPAPMPTGSASDTALDVARRVRALLEASGARVVVTREVTDSGDKVSAPARAKKAKEASATAVIGLVITASGQGGYAVMSVPATTGTEPFFLASASLASALAAAVKETGKPVVTEPAVGDAILTGTGVPAVRLRLGSTSLPGDRTLFADPGWADDVSRAVYRAIGSLYGSK
jgi:N-acetylmuramoyl-L-alanine amidase